LSIDLYFILTTTVSSYFGGFPRKVYHQVRRILGVPQKGIASSEEDPG
jgi:hypothetical protein